MVAVERVVAPDVDSAAVVDVARIVAVATVETGLVATVTGDVFAAAFAVERPDATATAVAAATTATPIWAWPDGVTVGTERMTGSEPGWIDAVALDAVALTTNVWSLLVAVMLDVPVVAGFGTVTERVTVTGAVPAVDTVVAVATTAAIVAAVPTSTRACPDTTGVATVNARVNVVGLARPVVTYVTPPNVADTDVPDGTTTQVPPAPVAPSETDTGCVAGSDVAVDRQVAFDVVTAVAWRAAVSVAVAVTVVPPTVIDAATGPGEVSAVADVVGL